PQSISFGNFDFSTPGQAENKRSKLKWDRCVYGQRWTGPTCSGSPIKLTWEEALNIASEAEGDGKRLPNIKELNTILDLQCIIPPTNLDIFPNTPTSTESGLWSSTPYIVEGSDATNAWYTDLGFGRSNYRAVDTKNFVRFINK
ncbi:MAG: DUF1566 domain-containing protein, partial [Proteobacteria bacterium]|nr:DUF1566 domain-containing protein [Pseudomonadota bacterium]